MPENTFLIVSTLPDTDETKYGYLTKLQAMYNKQRFLAVPDIPVDDAKEIVTRYMLNNMLWNKVYIYVKNMLWTQSFFYKRNWYKGWFEK